MPELAEAVRQLAAAIEPRESGFPWPALVASVAAFVSFLSVVVAAFTARSSRKLSERLHDVQMAQQQQSGDQALAMHRESLRHEFALAERKLLLERTRQQLEFYARVHLLNEQSRRIYARMKGYLKRERKLGADDKLKGADGTFWTFLKNPKDVLDNVPVRGMMEEIVETNEQVRKLLHEHSGLLVDPANLDESLSDYLVHNRLVAARLHRDQDLGYTDDDTFPRAFDKYIKDACDVLAKKLTDADA